MATDPRLAAMEADSLSERVLAMTEEERAEDLRATLQANGFLRDWLRSGFASAYEPLDESKVQEIEERLLTALLVPGLEYEDMLRLSRDVLRPYGVEPHEGCWWAVSSVDLDTKQDA